MEGQTNRTFYGQLKVLESTNPYLMPVEVKALNSLVNRNNWQYINLQSHLSAFAQIPLLTAYNMGGAVIGGSHQFDEKIDPKTGERYVSFTPRITIHPRKTLRCIFRSCPLPRNAA